MIDAYGTVTPSPDEDKTVTITLEFEVDGAAQAIEVPVTVLKGTASAGDGELIASYDMSHEGDKLKDISGKGNDATLYGAEDSDFAFYGLNVWQMDGDSYATLPASIMDDLGDSEDFTVQATLTTQTAAAHWLFAIGEGFGTWNAKSVGDYIFVNPSASEKSGNFLAAIKTGTGSDWKETRCIIKSWIRTANFALSASS